jgi:hypothetical protein
MTERIDPRLQLAPPGARSGAWLFALAFVLPVAITVVVVAVAASRAGAVRQADYAAAGGITLFCGALWWVLARFMRRQALTLSADALDVRSSFYRFRAPLAELKLEQARVVDLDEHTELKPTLKTNGFSIPGFHSGWFLLRNRRRTFLAIAAGRRKLWLPGNGRRDLLIEPRDPAALLAQLRTLAESGPAPSELAAARRRG